MIVSKIDWISKEAQEAIVTVSDGRFELKCFSQPLTLTVGDKIEFPLLALNIKTVVRSVLDEPCVVMTGGQFSYRLTAKVESIQESLLTLGGITILAKDVLPGDICEGEFVDFTCDRLDI